MREPPGAPRGRRTMACAEPSCARTGRSRACPSAWSAGGPPGERCGGNPRMYGCGKSDQFVVPANLPNKAAGCGGREEKGPESGGTRTAKHAPDAVPGQACQVGWTVCARWRDGIRTRGSPRCCTMSAWERLVLAYWALSPKAAPGVDGVTWQDYGRDLVANLRDLRLNGSTAGATGHGRPGGRTSRRRTGGCGRWASPRWRTRSSSVLSSRCSTPSTRRTSWDSPTGSGC